MKKITQNFFAKYPCLYTLENAIFLDSKELELNYVVRLLDTLATFHREHLVQKDNLQMLINCGEEINNITSCCSQVLQTRYTSSQLCHKIFKKFIEQRKELVHLNDFLQCLLERQINIALNKKTLKLLLTDLPRLTPLTNTLLFLDTMPAGFFVDSISLNTLLSMPEEKITRLGRLFEVMNIQNIPITSKIFDNLIIIESLEENLFSIIHMLSSMELEFSLETSEIETICSDRVLAHQIECSLSKIQTYNLNMALSPSVWKQMLKNQNRLSILNNFIDYCIEENSHLLTESVFQAVLDDIEEPKNPTNLLIELNNINEKMILTPEDIESYLRSDQEFIDFKDFIILCESCHCKASLTSENIQSLIRLNHAQIIELYTLSSNILNAGVTEMTPDLLRKLINSIEFVVPTIELLDRIMESHYPCLTSSVFNLIIDNQRHAKKLVTLFSYLRKESYKHLINSITLCYFIQHAENADDILSVLKYLNKRKLASDLGVHEITYLSTQSSHFYRIIFNTPIVKEKGLLTDRVLLNLVRNVNSIATLSELIRKFETWKPELLTTVIMEKMLFSSICFEQFAMLVEQIQRAVTNISQKAMSQTVHLILYKHEQLQNMIHEISAITDHYRHITLNMSLINRIIIKSQFSNLRGQILAHLSIHFTQPWTIDTRLLENLLQDKTNIQLLHSTLNLFPPTFLTPESFNTIVCLDSEYLGALHSILYQLAKTNTTNLINNEEVINYILHCSDHLVMLQYFIQMKSSYPAYSFLTANHVLEVLQHHTLSQSLPGLMLNTPAAPQGAWITAAIFESWCTHYRPVLRVAAQLSYQFYHHNRELLSSHNIDKLLLALLSQGDELSSLLFLIYEKNRSNILTQNTFDILTEPQSSILRLVYTLALDDITDNILSESTIHSFELYSQHLNHLEPLLLALSSAKAGLIDDTTLSTLVAQGSHAQEWVLQRVTENSPETWLPAITDPVLAPSEACSLKKLLRLYRSLDPDSRGGIPFLIGTAKKMVRKFIQNPRHLPWAENLAKHFLEGCVNQPVRGFSEISAWLFVAEQPSLVKKFEALRYPMILSLVQQKVMSENNMIGVEVEKANALFRQLCLNHPYTAGWDGIPEGIAYEHAITIWLKQQSFIHQLWPSLTFSSANDLKDFLYQQDFMNTWAPIAFQQEIEDNEALDTATKQRFYDLIETACEQPTTFLIQESHFPLLWPSRTPAECNDILQNLLEQGLSIPDIINRSFQSFSSSKEARIYNFITEQTNLIAQEFEQQRNAVMQQRATLLLSIRENATTHLEARRPTIFSRSDSPEALREKQRTTNSS